MPSLAEIIAKGHGHTSNHAWTLTSRPTLPGECIFTLRHYNTVMLEWLAPADDPTAVFDLQYYSLGWGTVSDKRGVNAALRVLGIDKPEKEG